MPLVLDSPLPSPPASVADPAEHRRTAHHSADVVIVGAGVTGTVLAFTFSRQGRSVILLERSWKEPDRIVGELLQPGGVAALRSLGLGDCLEGIDACVVKGYEVFHYGQRVNIPYPNFGSASNCEQRPEGRSFHHGRFVQKLRQAALLEPNVKIVETTATDLITNNWTGQVLGVQSLTHGEKDFYFAPLTVVADGYASKFRSCVSRQLPVAKSRFWGLELIDSDIPNPMHGHVFLGRNAPTLLYQIGKHETRVLVDVPEGLDSTSTAKGGIKGHLKNVVLPSMPEQIQPSFQAALDKGRLRSMPNSWLPAGTNRVPGMVLLGDALNMRHPLTGGGMTVAITDALLLRDLLSPKVVSDLRDTKLVLRQMRAFHWRRKLFSSTINILAQALYSLFAADDAQLMALRRGCFRYFQLGGNCVDVPAGLLGGLISQPFILFYHFFVVALLAVLMTLRASPIHRLLLTLLEGAAIFWKACVVIFPFIRAELRS